MDAQTAKLVEDAFSQSDLKDRVLYAATNFQGGIPELLKDVAAYIVSLRGSGQTNGHVATNSNVAEEPTTKKRKLEQSSESNSHPKAVDGGSHDISKSAEVLFECKDVSFTSPLRKKLRLQFVSDGRHRHIRLLNQATNAVEYTLRGEDIDATFCLPVPEKAQRQQNFVVFPLPGSQNADGSLAEPLVWTMNETKGKPDIVSESTRTSGTEDDTFVDVTRRDLNHFLAPLSKQIILPDEREFASEIPQSHRKGEKAFHTKAFRGSKEGYLFLLSTGIVFGFKKPIAYFPLHTIESISFTSVLQRTFNIVITTLAASPEGGEEQRTEHELSMVDQADFAPIDAYIRAHGLNDASMAAERRAKAYNVNKPKAGEEEASADADGRGEIEKAEEMLQDQEDEEEEDYDPSGGESEGSGEDSDEEDEEGYEEGEGGEEEWDEDEEVGPEEEEEA